MPVATTSVRLIELADAPVIAEHLARDAEASTQLENFASHKVLRNNGFRTWGTAHSHIYIANEWRDEVFWEQTLANVAPSE